MANPHTGASTLVRPLRVWPGVVLVAIQAVAMWVIPRIAPEAEPFSLPIDAVGLVVGLIAGLGVIVWWLFFSRALWFERAGILLLLVLALAIVRLIADPSISGAGMGIFLFIGSVPGWCLALVVGAGVASRWAGSRRFAAIAVAVILSCVPWALLRTAGMAATGSEYHWRWTPTPEQLLLARGDEVAVPPTSPVPAAPAPAVVVTPAEVAPAEVAVAPSVEWSGFRGPARDGVVRGVRINTDWSASPPVEIWRRAIGPGWSSFAVHGDLIYTQEQRGDDEMVACYRMSTGEPVWGHRDSVRFWESNGGAGPRATPTIHNGRVYAFGATGILNALDATTGALVWTRQVATDTTRALPIWGFSSSPLVVDGLVIVAAEGTLAAYDAHSGAHRWTGPSYGGSYSSPHAVVLDGVSQVVLLGGPGAISVAPADGTVLWTHDWEAGPIVQPAMTADGDILVNAIAPTGGIGTRRLAATRKANTWTLEARWTTNGLKPYFNDLVVHNGHAYGFDGSILAAIDLTTGTRKWKGGRYGNGQLILLADQDLLLVISEEGELALVSATPDGYSELARIPALDGKTWNHPVLIGSVLLVRNGQEMAAFRLSPPAR